MSSVVIAGNTSGSITLSAPATAGTNTITLPAETGTLVTTATSSGISGSAITTGTVGVSVGGTGTTSLTANNVILGNGTSAVQFVAPGSSGNVLTSNGTTWTSAAAAGGQLQTEIFTSPGTWNKPSSATQVTVRVVGGGGGASGSPGPGASITRGGAGGYALVAGVPVSGPVAITVGAGGTGGSNPNGSGTSGGTSSFGPAISCTGGNGGVFPGGTQTPGTATVSSGTAISLTSGFSDAYVGGGGSFNSGGSPAAVTYSVPAKYNAGAPQAVAPGGANTGGIGGVVVVEYVG